MDSMLLPFGTSTSGLKNPGGSVPSNTVSSAEEGIGIPRITLRQLTYFASAARHGSALRAAEELNISPPAVSGAIASLEAILQEQLFVRRHARGLVLTPAGQHLFFEARDIIGRVTDIELARHNDSDARRHRHISIGCLGDIASDVLPPLIRRFQTSHPDVEIRWHSDSHPQLMSRMEDGSLDLIIVLDFEITPTYQCTVLQPSPVRCVLPATHPLADSLTSLKQLAGEPFIMLDIPKTRDYFLSIFGDLGIQPKVSQRASSAEMVRSLVGNGFGYSLLNFNASKRKDIVFRAFDNYTSHSNLVAVRPYRRNPLPLVEHFIATTQGFMVEHWGNSTCTH